MKGISGIIAAILLLLIVVAITGFTFAFFQNLFVTSSNATSSQVGTTVTQVQQVVRIENVNLTAVTVVNAGGGGITPSSLTVYRGNTLMGCTWNPSTAIPSGSRTTCTFTGGQQCTPAGTQVKVNTISTFDISQCP